jgi:nucleoside-diphosphate-sugar epimerase
MRIFVTGATGVIGRRAVPLLIQGGHAVTAVGRSAAKRTALERLGASAIDIDLFDRAALERAVAGHDVIVNLATHMPSSSFRMMLRSQWRENDRVRREGSRTIADAALAAGVPRLVQESFGLIYPDRGAEWVDERTPVSPAPYNASTVDAERSAERFTASGGVGVVLRFAALYGPDDFAREMLGFVRRGWSPFPRPEAYYSSVAQDDAATAVVAALGVPAGIYNVVDDEPLTRRDYVDAMASAIGAKPPRFAPAWTAHLMGAVGELMSRSERISNAKLRAACDWAPRWASARAGWPHVVAELRRDDATDVGHPVRQAA